MESLAFYNVEIVSTPSSLTLGAAAPASSDDTLLRVYNQSTLYQAEDVSVALTGANANQLWLSLDGDVFTPAVEVGDIPPGGFSPPFWLRRVTPSDAAAGVYTATISATPSAWTHPIDTTVSDNTPLDTEDNP